MTKSVNIIGVPIDLGANRRGVDMGPSAIRYGGLKNAITQLNIEYKDTGNINVAVPENNSDSSSMKYINEITNVNKELFNMVSKIIISGDLPIILGGDHSIAVGSILGVQSVLKNIGVIWMDAHGDFNTPQTTLTGNLHGMSLSACTGLGPKEMTNFISSDVNFINPEKVVLIGIRNLDDEEAELIKKSGIHVFTMSDIDMHGMRAVMKKALNIVESGTEGFHLSFDIDVMNPNEAPGVGTPVKGGLTYREAHLSAEMIARSSKLRSIEFVEINPIIDNRNKTGELAVSLICSLLGQEILKDSK